MPRHQRQKSKSGYYHIMLRGNERRNLFNDDDDKQRFIETIYEKKQGNAYYLHAFCLMDNHVHIMLSEGIGDVARVMKRITVSYVYYFNKKYKRVGHLFQDRYRSEMVENDGYVLALARYIHQNPVKAGIVASADMYKWSSYQGYVDIGDYWSKMIDKEIIMELLSNNTAQYKKYMNEEADIAFTDLEENKEVIDDEEARMLFQCMLLEKGISFNQVVKERLPDEFIKDFKCRTNLSLRKIAAITGMNKDRINKIIKS